MSGFRIGRMVLGVCQTNCYFIYKEGVTAADGLCPTLVVDPADQGEQIYESLTRKGFAVQGILLTHGHVDHILGVKALQELSGARVYACEQERDVLQDMELNLSAMFNLPCKVTADVLLKDGEVCTVAGMTFRMIATPGHTEGSCCYYFEEGSLLISGDTLFEGSVGRTDFPTGSMSVLMRSMKQKLFALPEKTIVYPGHGGSTTIGWEKDNNPFVI